MFKACGKSDCYLTNRLPQLPSSLFDTRPRMYHHLIFAILALIISDVTCASGAFCSAPIEGTLGSNVVAVIDNVDSAEECDLSCVAEEQCSVYTFQKSNESTTCSLLTALGEPINECDSCVTGLPNCEGSICAFVDGGFMYPNGLLVKDQEREVELLALGACSPPVAVAIGGGGYQLSDLGGGGSGYVDYTTDFANGGYVKMVAHPSYGYGSEEDSYVIDKTDDIEIVRGRIGLSSGSESYDGAAGNFTAINCRLYNNF